jgi:hypothetical protein
VARVSRWHIFKTKIPILGKLLEGLAMEDVGIFYVIMAFFIYGLLVYFMVYLIYFGYILWLFGIFSTCWYVVHRKIWQPFSCGIVPAIYT